MTYTVTHLCIHLPIKFIYLEILHVFPFSFIADDAETIRKYVNAPKTYPKSKLVNVVMAQALDERIPPFILQMYGTNNKFNAVNVVNRWQFMKSELER